MVAVHILLIGEMRGSGREKEMVTVNPQVDVMPGSGRGAVRKGLRSYSPAARNFQTFQPR